MNLASFMNIYARDLCTSTTENNSSNNVC